MPEPIDIRTLRRKITESRPPAPSANPVDGDGGGPHDPGMETRVTRLEVEFQHVRQDLDEIKADLNGLGQRLDRMDTRLGELPSKRDLNTNLQWIVGVSVGVVALFVAVLTYLQDQRIAGGGSPPAPPAPIILQLPAPVPLVPANPASPPPSTPQPSP